MTNKEALKEGDKRRLTGNKSPRWKGGKFIYSTGYVKIMCSSHPYADKAGYVAEHRLVMELHIGRPLLPTETVHHINNDSSDNRIENLMLFSSNSEHARHHALMDGRIVRAKSKLSDGEVEKIREERKMGIPIKEIAKKYGIGICHTYDIVANKKRKTTLEK